MPSCPDTMSKSECSTFELAVYASDAVAQADMAAPADTTATSKTDTVDEPAAAAADSVTTESAPQAPSTTEVANPDAPASSLWTIGFDDLLPVVVEKVASDFCDASDLDFCFVSGSEFVCLN